MMKEFALLFRGADGESMKKRLSPQEWQGESQKWIDWLNELRKNGKLTGGHPLDAGGKVIRDRGDVISDGPFIESKEFVGGFISVSAKDISEAIEIAKQCPGFNFSDFTCEVRLVLDMPG